MVLKGNEEENYDFGVSPQKRHTQFQDNQRQASLGKMHQTAVPEQSRLAWPSTVSFMRSAMMFLRPTAHARLDMRPCTMGACSFGYGLFKSPNRLAPSEHPNLTTKIGSKMGGACGAPTSMFLSFFPGRVAGNTRLLRHFEQNMDQSSETQRLEDRFAMGNRVCLTTPLFREQCKARAEQIIPCFAFRTTVVVPRLHFINLV